MDGNEWRYRARHGACPDDIVTRGEPAPMDREEGTLTGTWTVTGTRREKGTVTWTGTKKEGMLAGIESPGIHLVKLQ